VGADLELVERPWAGAARVAFTAGERAAVGSDPCAAAALWVRKEAVVKALGLGFALPLDGFEAASEVRLAGLPAVRVGNVPAPAGLAAAVAVSSS
jgi:phosphopantetheinyl transferase